MDDGRGEEEIAQEANVEVISPPAYDWTSLRESYKLEGRFIERHGHAGPEEVFWRRLVWSPYGSHLLAQSDDHHIDLFELVTSEDVFTLKLDFSLRAPTTLLALEWYPYARYEDPSSWCFILGCRDVPARLVDAYKGLTRASYGIINHVERFVGPQCIAFSLDGSRLYFGLESEIAIFDLNDPGINTHQQLKLTPPKRAAARGKTASGQKGLISCLAVTQDHFAGTSGEILAVGTFSGTIGIYSVDGDSFRNAEERCLLAWNEKSAGIAQISFHPTAPHILFVTSRRDNEIRAYDLQYVGSIRSILHPPEQLSLLATFPRNTDTDASSQQRLGFSLDWAGRWLIAGDQSGSLSIWDVATPSMDDESGRLLNSSSGKDNFFGRLIKGNESPVRNVITRCDSIATDTIASTALHSTLPIVAVASGARHWEMSRVGVEEDIEESSGFVVRDGSIRLLDAHSIL